MPVLYNDCIVLHYRAFQVAQMVKNPPANAGATGYACSTCGSGRSPGGRNGNPLQNSCWGNPINKGDWWATVHGVIKELDMT